MEFKLELTSAANSDSEVQAITRDLCKTLNQQNEIKAKIAESEAGPGEKGDAFTLGTLLLTFLTSGAAAAIFKVLKAYMQRNKKLIVRISDSAGRTVEVNAENLTLDQFDRIFNRTLENERG